jgi:hypothetical protein
VPGGLRAWKLRMKGSIFISSSAISLDDLPLPRRALAVYDLQVHAGEHW